MDCRPGCGACCIAISISSPLPDLPFGKPAGVRCLHLNEKNMCTLFNQPSRPLVCQAFAAHPDWCGENTEQALARLGLLEAQTV
ncbi:MAG: YkgJ family cysteine cluster protein [Candidatus Omnitrophica bacterium]|nr:YkgJ family cysteine cluster protein [Candidatus Omnitrophota bacterium]